jgi:hypothetical protein
LAAPLSDWIEANICLPGRRKRRLHWKVGRLLAFEDAINIGGRVAILVYPIRPIGKQAAFGGEGRI